MTLSHAPAINADTDQTTRRALKTGALSFWEAVVDPACAEVSVLELLGYAAIGAGIPDAGAAALRVAAVANVDHFTLCSSRLQTWQLGVAQVALQEEAAIAGGVLPVPPLSSLTASR
jgi:hypothetical protein